MPADMSQSVPAELALREWRLAFRLRHGRRLNLMAVVLICACLTPTALLLLADAFLISDENVAKCLLLTQSLSPLVLALAGVVLWWPRPTTRCILMGLAQTPTSPACWVLAHFLPLRLLTIGVCLPFVLMGLLAVGCTTFSGSVYYFDAKVLLLASVDSLSSAWCDCVLILAVLSLFPSAFFGLLLATAALLPLHHFAFVWLTLVSQRSTMFVEDKDLLYRAYLVLGLKAGLYAAAAVLVTRLINRRVRRWAGS